MKKVQIMLTKLNFRIIWILLLVLSNNVFGQRLPETNFLRGIAMYERGCKDSSLLYFKENLEKDPNNLDSHFYMAKIYFEMNNNTEAIKQFLIVEKKQYARASLMLSKAYARLENPEKSIQYLDIHLKSKYKLPESRILLDTDLQNIDTDKLWIEYWRNNRSYSAFDETLAEANYMIKSKEPIEALNILSEGLKKGYRKPPLLALRAELYFTLDNMQLALDDLNKAISGDKRNSDLYALRGRIYMNQNKYKSALGDFNLSLKYSPEKFNIYILRAVAAQKSGNMDIAIQDMNFYLKYFPEDDNAWYNFGEIYKMEGLYFDALKCFNKCLSFNTSKAEYFASRGETYYHTRTYKYAGNDLSMALDLDPYNAKAYFFKGHTSIKLGDKEHACFCYEKAFEYGMKEAYNEMMKNCPLNNK